MPIFTGTTGNDTLTGTVDADTIIGNGGADTIDAGDGADTVVLTAQLNASPNPFGTIDGGAGIDTLQIERSYTPYNLQGGLGLYALSLAFLQQTFQGVTPITVITGFERLAFNSLAGDVVSVTLLYGGTSGQVNQIGPALSADATLIGGAGQDNLSLTYTASVAGGVVTAPSFTYSNWDTVTRAYLGGDRVGIGIVGPNGVTINGSAHIGVQNLNGGVGNDTINGSDDMDLISGGSGGSDLLFGNGGDDTLQLINTYLINPSTGAIGAESTRTGAGSTYNGGTGTDFLLLGGNVNFQGTIVDIEGLVLVPQYTNTNAGSNLGAGSQYYTTATFSGATFSAMPANLIVDGVGTVVVNLANGGAAFNGSAFQFDAGSEVTCNIVAGDGNDSVTGTISTDILYALGGSDSLNGLAGDDTIWLYDAAASAQGGADDDTFLLMANGGGSNINGGAGYDTLSVEEHLTPFNNTLTGTLAGIEEIQLVGKTLIMNGTQFATGLATNGVISGAGTLVVAMVAGTNFLAQGLAMNTASVAFNVIGSSGADIIKANANAVNIINSGDSNDQVRGGALNDQINGGNGNDKIIGFTGADTLTGGAGADQFRYLFASDSTVGARDHITDFLAGTDKFNFSLLDADPVAAGRQALTFIDTLAFSATGTAQVRYGVSGADLLVQVDLDGNGTADMEIVLDGASAQTLTGGDFML